MSLSMDFKAALVNNIKPFVPSNPPSFALAHKPADEPTEYESKNSTESTSRRRRRRRNNAARRQELAAAMLSVSNEEEEETKAQMRPLSLSPSRFLLPTPPSSNPHTPLKQEFTIPPIGMQHSHEANTQLHLVPDVPPQLPQDMEKPIFRLLQASPVIASLPVQETNQKVPFDILQAIASRARERLASRIQSCWDEQQKVIDAATKIQEAYAMHIEAQLENVVVNLKEHIGAEIERRFAESEHKRHANAIQAAQLAQQGHPNTGAGRIEGPVAAALSQLQAHCQQLHAVFKGMQFTQRETMEAVQEMKMTLENTGLFLPKFSPQIPATFSTLHSQAFSTSLPPHALANPTQHGLVNPPPPSRPLVNRNHNYVPILMTSTVSKAVAVKKPVSNGGLASAEGVVNKSKAGLGRGSQKQSIVIGADKENSNVGLQVALGNAGKADSPRL